MTLIQKILFSTFLHLPRGLSVFLPGGMGVGTQQTLETFSRLTYQELPLITAKDLVKYSPLLKKELTSAEISIMLIQALLWSIVRTWVLLFGLAWLWVGNAAFNWLSELLLGAVVTTGLALPWLRKWISGAHGDHQAAVVLADKLKPLDVAARGHLDAVLPDLPELSTVLASIEAHRPVLKLDYEVIVRARQNKRLSESAWLVPSAS